MFKKILFIITFISTAFIVTGCTSGDKNTAQTTTAKQDAKEVKQQPAQKVDYIVTTTIPTENAPGHTDNARPGYVKIYPHFSGYSPDDIKPITWFTKGLGSKLPGFPKGKLLEVINTDKEFAAYIGNVDEKMFQNYFEILSRSGFHFYPEKKWDNMSLYSEKYEVNLRFGQDGPRVTTVRARILTPEETVTAKKMIEDEYKEIMARKAKEAKEAPKPAADKPAAAKQ